ncbi:MAG: hypothetical protein KC535_01855 [Nanoarchaeota archaeon]|nr:hypothetical protein [Nanoarchaeota archaeon]
METKILSHKDPTTGLALDTLSKRKQALVFCASKRAAESQAEKIAKTIKNDSLLSLSEQILHVLANPTKQCRRLASCVRKGIAFHHAGLASKQRELIEDHFRKGDISIICSTPTLAAGLDMPAFRSIIRDTKRFGPRGMQPIPVLEYEQMSGRAGRPGKEDYGEAIIIASKEGDIEYYTDRYINGEVEELYSKLAVEPVLRTYVLSLVSTEFIKSTQELYDFFDTTFYAHQYGDTQKLHATLDRMIGILRRWEFLEGEQRKETIDFVSASDLEGQLSEQLVATPLGKRVSEMYIDPLTAHTLLTGLPGLSIVSDEAFALSHLLCCALELRPLLGTKVGDLELIESLRESRQTLITEEEFYRISQDDFEDTLKTAKFFEDWMNEMTEDQLLETYQVRPGEISIKMQTADWLLYACEELARMKQMQPLLKIIKRVRTRVKHGVRNELIPLLSFKGIGRSRARKLFSHNIQKVSDVTQTSYEKLSTIVGTKIAANLKEQVGEKVEVPQKAIKKRVTLHDF